MHGHLYDEVSGDKTKRVFNAILKTRIGYNSPCIQFTRLYTVCDLQYMLKGLYKCNVNVVFNTYLLCSAYILTDSTCESKMLEFQGPWLHGEIQLLYIDWIGTWCTSDV